MNLYKITCTSECGSYFGAYLQSVVVVAESEPHALNFITDWMAKGENPSFIYPYKKTKKDVRKREYQQIMWEVTLLLEDVGNKEPSVIDTLEDSDY